MADIRSYGLYATVSSTVSSVDGVPYKTVQPQVSAFLMTMADFIQRTMNRIDTQSTTLVSGGSAGSVAVALGAATSGIQGSLQGVPFFVSPGSH
jgi:hypothetical protein